MTINPNARAKMYRRLKAAAERRGTWDVGYEEPLYTLGDVLDHDRYSLEEYSIGWLMQLHFVKYVLPHPLRMPYIALHELVQTGLWFLNRAARLRTCFRDPPSLAQRVPSAASHVAGTPRRR